MRLTKRPCSNVLSLRGMRLIKRPCSNRRSPVLMNRASLIRERITMEIGRFYYLTDQYFVDFDDSKLMQNRENINGTSHDRPCFFAFIDKRTNLYWLIPISSQVKKFRRIYSNKVNKHGFCNTIVFGKLAGFEKAFLIQNMCPASDRYIKNEYRDAGNIPIRVNGVLEQDLISNGKKVLALQRKGYHLILPDVLSIEKRLLAQQNM